MTQTVLDHEMFSEAEAARLLRCRNRRCIGGSTGASTEAALTDP